MTTTQTPLISQPDALRLRGFQDEAFLEQTCDTSEEQNGVCLSQVASVADGNAHLAYSLSSNKVSFEYLIYRMDSKQSELPHNEKLLITTKYRVKERFWL